MLRLPRHPKVAVAGAAGLLSLFLLADVVTTAHAGTIDLVSNGTAAQNSQLSSFGPGRAIDGDTGNFTHTDNNGPDPAIWQVLIDDGVYNITDLILHNRDDCCQGRLRDLTVEVVDFSGEVTTDFALGSGGTASVNTFTELGALINPGNSGTDDTGVTLNGGDNPSEILIDFVAMTGAPAQGNLIRIARDATVPQGNDDQTALSLGEVEANGALVPEPSGLLLAALALAVGLLPRARGRWRRR